MICILIVCCLLFVAYIVFFLKKKISSHRFEDDVIGCFIDLEAGKIRFALNGKKLAASFEDLNLTGLCLYPAVSVSRDVVVEMEFGHHFKFPPWEGHIGETNPKLGFVLLCALLISSSLYFLLFSFFLFSSFSFFFLYSQQCRNPRSSHPRRGNVDWPGHVRVRTVQAVWRRSGAALAHRQVANHESGISGASFASSRGRHHVNVTTCAAFESSMGCRCTAHFSVMFH